MAIKFKSKYTAKEIENILDSIGATAQDSFVRVDELPDPTQANTALFYVYDNKVWYVNTTTSPYEWAVVEGEGGNAAADKNEGIIDTEEVLTSNEFNFTDFVLVNDTHFTLTQNSASAQFISSLQEKMVNEEKSFYTISGIEGKGWVDGYNENNILSAQSSYTPDVNMFYIKLTLVDGTDVKISLEDNDKYLINYIGYAL
jgi:hypothetical protein